jgi:hypothetical protein
VSVPQAPTDSHRDPQPPPAGQTAAAAGTTQAEARRARVEPQPDSPLPPRGREPVGGAVAVSDRAADADLLLDVPQLAVEELSVELEASPLLNRIKLEAKGLDVGLFLKADFGGLADLAHGGGGPGPDIGAMPRRPRRRDAARIRGGLRDLLGSTRDAYRELSDRDVQKQLREVHESAREAYAHLAAGADEPDADREPADDEREPDDRGTGQEEPGGGESRAQAAGQRALHAAKQGGKAAGLTAAGIAGGALLEARRKPHGGLSLPAPKMPLPRRRNRAQAIAHDLRRRLP